MSDNILFSEFCCLAFTQYAHHSVKVKSQDFSMEASVKLRCMALCRFFLAFICLYIHDLVCVSESVFVCVHHRDAVCDE